MSEDQAQQWQKQLALLRIHYATLFAATKERPKPLITAADEWIKNTYLSSFFHA